MDIHAAAAATVVQTISSTLATLKNARDLAKDSKDHELKGVIGDAFDALLDLKERILALDEENRELKAKLSKREAIAGPLAPFGYLFKNGDMEHPLCPNCYQEKGMRDRRNNHRRYSRRFSNLPRGLCRLSRIYKASR